VRINFYATLRQIVGRKTLDMDVPEDTTLRQLLDEIIQLHPSMRRELYDETGALFGHVHVLVNGRDAPYLDNVLDTILVPDDVVSIFPAVGGGCD